LRHAERPPGDDPPLSPLGQQRAQELVQVAGEAGVTAIYATQFIRTQQTAQPLADHLGLDVNIFNVTDNSQQYADDLVDHILSEHRGEVVLIVSHSHTVHLIVEALGASPIPAIPGNKYDNLFIVTVPRGRALTKNVKVEYGEDSP
jgi:broad specificity phosphatase PhoE